MLITKRWSAAERCFVLGVQPHQDPGVKHRIYVARIISPDPDPDYVVRRTFLPQCHMPNQDRNTKVYYLLWDGLYEAVVKDYDIATSSLTRTNRRWIIVFHGTLYEYEGNEISLSEARYIVFNLDAQRKEPQL